MAGTNDLSDLRFEAPGPGFWTVENGHMTRPVTAHMASSIAGAFRAGFAETMRRYGAHLEALDLATVNGFAYGSMRMAPMEEMQERIATAEETFAVKRWRGDLEWWDTEVKPATIEAHRALVGVDPDLLDDDGLVEYIRRCAGHHSAMVTQHHRFNCAAIIPVGDFLAHAMEWTGASPGEVIGVLAGASPISCGRETEIDRAADAIRADADAQKLLEAGDLDTLRGRVPAVDDWLIVAGYRLLEGFDVDSAFGLERPALLVDCLRRAVDAPVEDVTHDAEVAALRERVPAEHRNTFDELLAEAQLVYRLRDERGVYSDMCGAGIMRRALLAAGRRLLGRGVVDDPELAVEATVDELDGLLRGGATQPDGVELRSRREFRFGHTVADAPPALGDPPPPPPPLEMLPPGERRLMTALMTFMGNAFGQPPAEADDDGVLRGIPANQGTHAGRVCIIRTIDDVDRLEPGDVLVASATSESLNLALSLAGAVITDIGGVLSHAAIMAREYGIPAVVGTEQATTRLSNGDLVTVDGTAGEVRVGRA